MTNLFKNLYSDSLIKNSIYLMSTNFTNLVLGFFFWIIASRNYTPQDIGIASSMLSSISLISMIASMGFPTALIFYISKDAQNANKIISSCLTVGIIVSITISLVFILGIKIWAPILESIFNKTIITIYILAAMTTIISEDIMTPVFTAKKKTSFHMIKENIFGLIKIIFLILFIGLGTTGIFLSWSIGLVMAVFVGFCLLYKMWRYLPTITIDPIIKNIAKFSFGNYVVAFLLSLPRLTFPILIMNLISTDAAGYFFVAMTMASLLWGISQSISNCFIADSDKEQLMYNAKKSIMLNIGLFIPCFVLFLIFGKIILNLFNINYGQNATITLIILSAASLPLSVINMFISIRNIQKRIYSTIKINIIIVIMTFIFSIPLIKIAGIDGAAISYLASTTIAAIIIIYASKKYLIISLRDILISIKMNISSFRDI